MEETISKVLVPSFSKPILLSNSDQTHSELPNAELKITASASYPLTSAVVDFLRPLLLRLTVWR